MLHVSLPWRETDPCKTVVLSKRSPTPPGDKRCPNFKDIVEGYRLYRITILRVRPQKELRLINKFLISQFESYGFFTIYPVMLSGMIYQMRKS